MLHTENIKLLIFDIDGTLVRDYNSFEMLPGRAKFFNQPGLPKVAFATNQGGVGLRYWMESSDWGDPIELPTIESTGIRLGAIADQFPPGFEAEIFMCFAFQSKKGQWAPIPPGAETDSRWLKEWRKPAPGMLLAAMEYYGISPEQTLMVGDSDDDRLAAEAAGCQFILAEEFFKPYLTTVKFTYHSQFVYGWLATWEMVGLDVISTLARFEKKVQERIGNWDFIRTVEFERNDEEEGLAFKFGPIIEIGDETVQIMGRQVLDLNINKHWLVYESAKVHAKALAFARDWNLRTTLVQDISDAYGLDYFEAKELVEKTREEMTDGTN